MINMAMTNMAMIDLAMIDVAMIDFAVIEMAIEMSTMMKVATTGLAIMPLKRACHFLFD